MVHRFFKTLSAAAVTTALCACGADTEQPNEQLSLSVSLAPLSLIPESADAISDGADHDCVFGGVREYLGEDVNGNFLLDEEEVAAQQDTCFDTALPRAWHSLNDTGIVWAGHYPKTNNPSTCVAQHFDAPSDSSILTELQDCAAGRDTVIQADGDGFAGFSYRKIAHAGSQAWIAAPQWQCTADQITGLLWLNHSGKNGTVADQGILDGDDRFTWYNTYPDQNGGDIGDWNAGVPSCSGMQPGSPTSYCNSQAYIDRVNAHRPCGRNDWRLPAIHELQSLLHYGQNRPAVEENFFPFTHSGLYWSVTPMAGSSQSVWAVSFEFGYAAPSLKTEQHRIRLVAGQPQQAAPLVLSDNGVWLDQDHGLMWAPCPLGMSGTACQQGDGLSVTWLEAMKTVADQNLLSELAGHRDWRLPSVRELSTLLDFNGDRLRVDLSPAPAGEFWTSSPYHFYSHYAWYVDFDSLQTSYGERIQGHRQLWLVRDF